MQKNWYLVNMADKFFSNYPHLKGTVCYLCKTKAAKKKDTNLGVKLPQGVFMAFSCKREHNYGV